MKKILFTILLLVAAINVRAYDFSAVCSTGHTLYYNITSDSTVMVVAPNSRFHVPDDAYWNGGHYSSSNSNYYFSYGKTISYWWYSDWGQADAWGFHKKLFHDISPNGKVIIPQYVTYDSNTYTVSAIGQNAFAYCSDMTGIVIPEGIVTIGDSAFNGCSSIDSIWFNAKRCMVMDSSVLRGVHPQYLQFGNSVARFPDNAFTSLQYLFDTIAWPDSIRYIGANNFRNNTLLSGLLAIPYTVDTIGDQAFYGCSGIDSLYLNCGLQTIGAGAFSGCTGLKYLYYNARNCSSALSPFANTITSQFTTLVIGDSVEALPSNAFRDRSSINNLVIPSNVVSIGDSAFFGCSGIDTLIICSDVQSIGSFAFSGCTGIVSLHIGSGITAIGNSVFQGCTGFSKLLLPESVTSIGSNAFYGCTSIDSLYIGSNVQTIGSGALRGCTGLTWLNYNAPTLPAQGFYGCTQLETLILGNNVQSIGSEAFYNCDNLISASISANQIGNNAFANCDRLVSVTLGDSTRTLGNGAFSGCFRLQNINLGGVTAIGDNAFDGCVRLERPELPANLTTIGTRAFNNCNLLNGKLTFPATITSIGDYAYSGVGSITEIEMLGANPPTIYANTFASVSNSTPVSVPCGAVLNYYTTNYWENFSTIVEAPPYKLTVQSNNETMGSAAVSQQPSCSNHSAIIQATAEAGFHFLQWNDGNGTNPRTIQMTQDSTFTAIFVPNNSYIVVEPNDPTMGTTSGTGTYGYNAPVTMTATAYSGYHFLRWNDGNTQNPRYMAAVCDTTFTAIFVSNVSTITVMNANPEWGNVGGSGVYYYQNLVSLTATPNYGYHFSQWNDGNTQNPRTIVINQDSTFTAYFAVNTYSIVATSNSTTMGSVSGGGTYTYLHEMSLTATPAYGYHFVQWNDQNTDNPRTITVTRDSAFTAQFAANSYTITAEPNDPTMGSAYGSGTYNYNTTATLTAVAEYGYHFTQWSDGVTDNPRTITVQNSATYTAQFEINSYILTVQSSNPAIGTTSGGGSYNYLTPVNISANPNAGYHFTQWSDGNTDNPRLISVTQNATYVAQFAINSYAVGVVSNNTSMGSVSGSGTYNHNATATLTATAFYGYHFVQWSDGNTDNPRSVVVTDSAQYTAEFTFNSYLVIGNSSNVTLGSVTGGGSYNYLSQVALTAVPVPHYHFTMWNDNIEDNPRTITVTRDTLFTAHFAIDRHTIGVHTSDAVMGTVSSSDTVDYNTAVWITATANYGYHFTQWNDGTTSNPRRVVVSQDTAFTASFAPNQYSATCAVNDNSRGSVASTGGNYNYLTSVTFTAIPNSDYHFLRWSNGSTDNPVTFTLRQDTTFTAILVGLTANVNDNTMGTVTHSKPSNLVEVVTATPNYGYHFVQWNDGISDNPRTVVLVGDTTLTALFAVNNYYVALGVNDESLGSVEGENEYPYLSTVTITATATEHSHFVQWSDGNTTNPRMLTVTRDTSLTAYFSLDQQFQITVNANDTTMGSVEGSGTYFIGETVSITATANEHYYFAQWSDGMTNNPRVVTVTGDMTYTAVFEPVMYTLTVAANDYSMGQVTGGGSYAYGTEVTIEARAFGGYSFNGWSDGVMDEQRRVTVTEDATYTAIFGTVGIDDVDSVVYKVYVSDGRIVVEGVEGKRVQIFDIAGREHRNDEQLPMGVYMVRIDGVGTKKVVVR